MGKITVTPEENLDVVCELLTRDKKTFYASMTDIDLQQFEAGEWYPNNYFLYLTIKEDDNPVGILRIKEFSPIAVEAHSHLFSTHWGNGTSTEMSRALEGWLQDNTPYLRIVTYSPACCKEVIRALIKDGYTLDAVMPHTTFWRGEIRDLAILGKTFRRNT